ncbi:MAG: DUF86 domain-containing protein [Candidatus Viridilinea halotolerans]|uniref:DUF86 domain-containing protein n=1 Tax=Candidatus Viridilinea halotolerans TaxID=2491704 RepID=A0A426TT01_9CHLR|nr:MAG: DUF86 domain-containing protein [Candidatus Viridilinea halotolerans]
MSKDDMVYLGHMLDMARKIATKVHGISRQTYDNDENLRLALAHLVQVIGEAARRVSVHSQTNYAKVPWREIIGMRHKIVHDYMDVDEDVVWEVATKDIPPLITMLAAIVPHDEHG